MYYALEEGLFCVVAAFGITASAFAIYAAILLVQEAVRHGIRALQQAGGGILRFILGGTPHSLEGSGRTSPAVARYSVLPPDILKFGGHRAKL